VEPTKRVLSNDRLNRYSAELPTSGQGGVMSARPWLVLAVVLVAIAIVTSAGMGTIGLAASAPSDPQTPTAGDEQDRALEPLPQPSIQEANNTTTEREDNDDRTSATQVDQRNATGSITTTSDVDWFVFEADPARVLTIVVTKPVAEGSLDVQLYTPTRQVDRGRVADGEKSGKIADTSDAQMLYYVRIEGRQQTTTDYTVAINSRETDAFEPNEDRIEPERLDLSIETRTTSPNGSNTTRGDRPTRTATVRGEVSPNDDDWFVVTVPPAHRVSAALAKDTGTETSVRVDLVSTGATVDSERFIDEDRGGAVAATSGERAVYYVWVRGDTIDDSTSYNLTVKARPTDRTEPNERPEEAISVGSNETVSAEITEGDSDWYQFTVAPDRRVTVDVSNPGQNEQTLLTELYRSGSVDRDVLSASDTGVQLGDTAGEAAVYFLRVEGDSYDDVNEYTVSIATESTDSFEPNERSDTAVGIEPNTTLRGEVTENDEEWIRVAVPADREIVASLQKSTGTDTAVTVELYQSAAGEFLDPSEPLGQVFLSDSESRKSVGDTTGSLSVYYVRIAGQEAGHVTEYNLTISARPTDSFEPNERASQATIVESNESQSGAITRNDVDWYAVSVPAGHRLLADVSKPAGAGSSLSVELFSPVGENPFRNAIAQASVADDERGGLVAETIDRKAVYYVRVSGESQADRSSYAIDFETVPTDRFEPNGDQIRAAPFPVNSSIEAELSERDDDWYRFAANAGDTIQVAFETPPGRTIPVTVEIYTPDGPAEEIEVGPDETIGAVSYTVPSDARYYVRIVTEESTGATPYELEVERES